MEEAVCTTTVTLPIDLVNSYYVESQRCCRNATITNIFAPDSVLPSPQAKFDFEPKELSNFSKKINITDQSEDASMWKYYFRNNSLYNIREPSHIFADTGIYVLRQYVKNDLGCIDSFSLIADLKHLYTLFLPNSFLPSGNNENTVFGPVGIPFGIRKFEMIIYDRWGNRVFRSTSFEDKWDGKNSGGKELLNRVK